MSSGPFIHKDSNIDKEIYVLFRSKKVCSSCYETKVRFGYYGFLPTEEVYWSTRGLQSCRTDGFSSLNTFFDRMLHKIYQFSQFCSCFY